jgi:DNA-binding beta-propeller fold protein YncE
MRELVSLMRSLSSAVVVARRARSPFHPPRLATISTRLLSRASREEVTPAKAAGRSAGDALPGQPWYVFRVSMGTTTRALGVGLATMLLSACNLVFPYHTPDAPGTIEAGPPSDGTGSERCQGCASRTGCSAIGSLHPTNTCYRCSASDAGPAWVFEGQGKSYVCTVAGGTFGKTDGEGTRAGFKKPRGISFDSSSGSIFVADTGNNLVRLIRFASASKGFEVETIGTSEGLSAPEHLVAVDASTVYVANTGAGNIVKLSKSGGSWSQGEVLVSGTASCSSAVFVKPTGITYDSDNRVLLVADPGCGSKGSIHFLDLSGQVKEVTYSSTSGTPASSYGVAWWKVSPKSGFVQTQTTSPYGVATPYSCAATTGSYLCVTNTQATAWQGGSPKGVDFNNKAGMGYLADSALHLIFAVNLTAVSFKTYATAGVQGYFGFVDGRPIKAMFNSPYSVAVTKDGLVFIADSGNNAIRLYIP